MTKIDYILCSQRWRSSVLSAKQDLEMTVAQIMSNLIAKFRLKHKTVGETTRPLSSVQLSHSVMSDSLQPHELQHARPPCPSPTPRVHPIPCPLSQWCHPTILSSVVPFSSCPHSCPASGSFQMSQLFASGGQSIGVSASPSACGKS